MAAEDWGVESSEKYWYNTKTGEVEHGKISGAVDRLGPFDTEAEAKKAPEIAKERAASWAAEEAAEDNWGAND